MGRNLLSTFAFNFAKCLILIEPGYVKVDLANFDVKFQAKFVYVRFFKIDLFLQKRFANLFELLT
jgi:hypothetical protein